MKTLESMRNTLPNTDQPRIPHSEHHYIWCRRSSELSTSGLRDLLPGALLSPRQALLALHHFGFYFFRFFSGSFPFFFFFPLPFNILYFFQSNELGYPSVSYLLDHRLLRASALRLTR